MAIKINKIRGHNLYIVTFDDRFQLISALIRFITLPDDDPDSTYSYTNQQCYELIYGLFKTPDIFATYNAFYFNLQAMITSYGNNISQACEMEEDLTSKMLLKKYDYETVVIAYTHKDITALKHELCHYLFDKNIKYRENVINIIDSEANKYDVEALRAFLVASKYDPNDVDEVQAHIISEKNLQKDLDLSKKLCSLLKANFNKYSKSILERIKK